MEYRPIPRHTFNRAYVSLRVGDQTFAVPESHASFIDMVGYVLNGVYEITDDQTNQPIQILGEVGDKDALASLLSQMRNFKKQTV